MLPEPTEASWSASMRRAKLERVTLPWDRVGVKPDPVRHITRYEKVREECAYNPLLAVFTDSAREAKTRERDSAATILAQNRARDRQLTQAQTYNIITHRPVVGEPTPAPRRTKIPDTRLQHNIISNLDFSEHHHAPPEERPVVDIPPPRRLLKSAESKAEKRVYDVLTNKYKADHDAKVRLDLEAAQRDAAERFWRTRDYNPVTAGYYDVAKEERFVAERAAKERAHPTKAYRTLPPSVMASEGMATSIISHKVVDADRLRTLESAEASSALHRVRHSVEAYTREEGLRAEDRESTRALGRIVPQRFQDSVRHGHDPITNESFTGMDARRVFDARVGKKEAAWSKIEAAGGGAGAPRVRTGGFS